MSLDIFSDDQRDAYLQASRNLAPAFPAEGAEAFSTAWREGLLFAQSIASQNAREAAVYGIADDLFRRTGDQQFHRSAIATKAAGRTVGDPLAALNDTVAANANRYADLAPITEEEVQTRAVAVSREARESYKAMAAREKTLGGSLGFFAGSMAAGVTDPINLIAFPLAAPQALGVLGTGLAWAGIAGVTQAAIEITGGPFRESVEPGHLATGEPLRNIFAATGLGGILGSGFKGGAAVWERYKTGAWPRSIRDAGNVVESEANIASANRFDGVEGEAFHRTALQRAIDALIEGRPFTLEQEPFFDAGILRGYEARITPVMEARTKAMAANESALSIEREGARLPPTMERLSEIQLGEIRATGQRIEAEGRAAREALQREAEAIDTARPAIAARQGKVETLRAEVDTLRNDMAAVDRRAAEARPATDAVTQERLAAIETDLAAPALSAERRAALTAERRTITETLAATARDDSRLAASLAQERQGIAAALARKEAQVARASESTTAAAERLQARAARLPGRQENAEARLSSRREAVANELRRSIARLSEDGYGVRLPREDAEALASRVLQTSDQDAEAVLREVTESLVDRAVELRRSAPPELPGIGQPAPAAQARARAGYHTEDLRKRIGGLARAAGYAMPREESAAIAARITSMSEHEALAVLDELLLRPRTLADTLPTTAPPVERTAPTPAPMYRSALDAELSRERVETVRAEPETDAATLRNLDRLRAERGDFEVPMGETVDADGKPMAAMRRVDDLLAEADSRELAAREILDCVGPQQGSAAA